MTLKPGLEERWVGCLENAMSSLAASQMKIFKNMKEKSMALNAGFDQLTNYCVFLCKERTPILNNNNIGGQVSANEETTRDHPTIFILP